MGVTEDIEIDVVTLVVRAQDAAKRRDLAAARADFEAALSGLGVDGPHVPVRAGLGWVLRQMGDLGGSLAQYEAALAHQTRMAPDDAQALAALREEIAGVLAALGRQDEALGFYRLMLDGAAGPARDRLLGRAAEAARGAGRAEEQASLQREMLDGMRARLPVSTPLLAGTLTTIGMAEAAADRLEQAEVALREAVSLVPGLGYATQTLVNVLSRRDKPREAREVAIRHYGRKSFWERRAKGEQRGTLLTLVALNGNIPEQHLLARLGFSLVIWQVEFGPEHDRQLPPYDLVLTQVADADHGEAALRHADAFAQRCGKPVLNDPATVLRTRRDLIPSLLGGIEGLVIPQVARLPGEMDAEAAVRACEALGFAMPVILRVAGQHGGKKVALSLDLDEVRQDWDALGERDGTYVTRFSDYRSADGFCRKYRVIFVDRTPMPYHLAISPHWLVHYFSADMQAYPWKQEEEMRFLADMEGALGTRAVAALREIGRRMDLDYCGIDFGLTADGDVLLFEANATMLVHPEAVDGPFAAKNPFIDRILGAFDDLVRRRLEG